MWVITNQLKKLFKFIRTLFAVGKPKAQRPRRGRKSTVTTLDWVIPGKVALGGLPQPDNIDLFSRENIKVVLSLCAPAEGTLPVGMEQAFYCVRLTLPDSHYSYEMSVERLSKAVDVIHQCMSRNLPIYVHCLAGIERSPTVCIAYLCRFQGLELWEAIDFVKRAHPPTCPSAAQIQIVRRYLSHVNQSGSA
uniref:Dual specificity protein phosphatase n=1 Tax=Cyanothece sp. (strain PCC 7425 / ATCC 29141) TaxID=395961 RepID=B8HLI6_CYAP4